MGGLARICKTFGELTAKGKDGKKVNWRYDYIQDIPRLESEMTKQEIEDNEKFLLNLKKQNGL